MTCVGVWGIQRWPEKRAPSKLAEPWAEVALSIDSWSPVWKAVSMPPWPSTMRLSEELRSALISSVRPLNWSKAARPAPLNLPSSGSTEATSCWTRVPRSSLEPAVLVAVSYTHLTLPTNREV